MPPRRFCQMGFGTRSGVGDDSCLPPPEPEVHAMIRRLAVSIVAALAGAAQAQQWVERSDALAFDKLPPVWCNAERSACAVSRQPYGATGALRIALTVAGTPDCKYRRPRYVFVRRSGEK